MIRSWMGKAVAATALSLAAATSAQAQIQNISFGTSVLVRPTGNVGSNQAGAPNLLLDFLTGAPPTVEGGTTGTVTVGDNITGFTGLAAGTQGTISDLTINSTGGVGPFSVSQAATPFITAGGYQFFATSFPNATGAVTFGPIGLVQTGSGTTANLGVNGTVTGGTFGATGAPFVGTLSATFSGLPGSNQLGVTPDQLFAYLNAGNSLTTTVSSNFSAQITTVPEPSTYALMAFGLAGLGFAARRRRTA